MAIQEHGEYRYLDKQPEFYAPKKVSTSSSLLSPRLYERILQAREKVKGRSRGRASTIFAGQYSQPGRTMLNLFGSSQLKRLLGE